MSTRQPNWSRLPEHTRDSLQRYLEHGIPPGDFLMAVLSNDLYEAFGRADETNRAAMFDIVSFFWNDAPSACWGSPDKVRAWMRPESRSLLAKSTGVDT